MTMHLPIQPCIPKSLAKSVLYRETNPSKAHAESVYCLWRLRSLHALSEDFMYRILPDACVDIIFSLSPVDDLGGVLVMCGGQSSQDINLGKEFNYIGVRLPVGALNLDHRELIGGKLFLSELVDGFNYNTFRLGLLGCRTPKYLQDKLHSFLELLKQSGVLASYTRLRTVLSNPPLTVGEFALRMEISERQLRRMLPRIAGCTPKQLLNILQLQYSLKSGRSQYADQSHYIRSFKKSTQQTPARFKEQYHMSDLFNT